MLFQSCWQLWLASEADRVVTSVQLFLQRAAPYQCMSEAHSDHLPHITTHLPSPPPPRPSPPRPLPPRLTPPPPLPRRHSRTRLKTLVQAMDNSDVVTTNGFSIGDMKYVYLSSIPGKVIRGKAKGRKSGVHVCLTKQGEMTSRLVGLGGGWNVMSEWLEDRFLCRGLGVGHKYPDRMCLLTTPGIMTAVSTLSSR